MSVSNGVIMIWLCASTCFSGAAALKSFDADIAEHKQTPCAICTEGTTLKPDAVFESKSGHTLTCQEAQKRADNGESAKKTFYCGKARNRWASTCCRTAEEMKLEKQRREATSCQCVGWQDAYNKLGAECSGLGKELCTSFLKRLPNERLCIKSPEFLSKIVNTTGTDESWCYVSDACEQAKASDWDLPTHWKTCGKDEPGLEDMSFEELSEWATKQDLDIGMVAQWAYPEWTGETLGQVLEFWELKAPEGADFKTPPISEELGGRLYKQVTAGNPMFIMSKADHPHSPPFAVVEGGKLYWINFGGPLASAMKQGKDFFEHPGIMNEVKCVSGCNNVSAPWMSFMNYMEDN